MAKRLYVVGLGPGDPRYFTGQARAALEDAQVLCGYTVYVELIRCRYPDKETYTTPMTREIDRCRWALEAAEGGAGEAYGLENPHVFVVRFNRTADAVAQDYQHRSQKHN